MQETAVSRLKPNEKRAESARSDLRHVSDLFEKLHRHCTLPPGMDRSCLLAHRDFCLSYAEKKATERHGARLAPAVQTSVVKRGRCAQGLPWQEEEKSPNPDPPQEFQQPSDLEMCPAGDQQPIQLQPLLLQSQYPDLFTCLEGLILSFTEVDSMMWERDKLHSTNSRESAHELCCRAKATAQLLKMSIEDSSPTTMAATCKIMGKLRMVRHLGRLNFSLEDILSDLGFSWNHTTSGCSIAVSALRPASPHVDHRLEEAELVEMEMAQEGFLERNLRLQKTIEGAMRVLDIVLTAGQSSSDADILLWVARSRLVSLLGVAAAYLLCGTRSAGESMAEFIQMQCDEAFLLTKLQQVRQEKLQLLVESQQIQLQVQSRSQRAKLPQRMRLLQAQLQHKREDEQQMSIEMTSLKNKRRLLEAGSTLLHPQTLSFGSLASSCLCKAAYRLLSISNSLDSGAHEANQTMDICLDVLCCLVCESLPSTDHETLLAMATLPSILEQRAHLDLICKKGSLRCPTRFWSRALLRMLQYVIIITTPATIESGYDPRLLIAIHSMQRVGQQLAKYPEPVSVRHVAGCNDADTHACMQPSGMPPQEATHASGDSSSSKSSATLNCKVQLAEVSLPTLVESLVRIALATSLFASETVMAGTGSVVINGGLGLASCADAISCLLQSEDYLRWNKSLSPGQDEFVALPDIARLVTHMANTLFKQRAQQRADMTSQQQQQQQQQPEKLFGSCLKQQHSPACSEALMGDEQQGFEAERRRRLWHQLDGSQWAESAVWRDGCWLGPSAFACEKLEYSLVTLAMALVTLMPKKSNAVPPGALLDTIPSLRKLGSWVQSSAGMAALELCVRLMHDKRPTGYHSFPILLQNTELLENSWAPVVRACAMQQCGKDITPELNMLAGASTSLTMSLVKMVKQTFNDRNEAYAADPPAAFSVAAAELATFIHVALSRLTASTVMAKTPRCWKMLGLCKPSSIDHFLDPSCSADFLLEQRLLLILIRVSSQLQRIGPADLVCPPMTIDVIDGDTAGELIMQACTFDVPAVGGAGAVIQASWLAMMWERYALSNLKGLALPGCSYWHCTNLSGFSERAIITRLCGGCKRVRYCCKECQKGAWIEGHKEVCTSLKPCEQHV